MPDSYSIGSPQEAAICASECVPVWQVIPRAIDWLRTQSTKVLPTSTLLCPEESAQEALEKFCKKPLARSGESRYPRR